MAAFQPVADGWFLSLCSPEGLTRDDGCKWCLCLWLSDETWTGDQSTHKTSWVGQSPTYGSDFKIETSRNEYSEKPGLLASYDLASKSRNVIFYQAVLSK